MSNRRAVEIFESERGKKAERRPDQGPSGLDVKMPCVVPESSAGVAQVARVLSEVYGDRMASCAGENFPLQQKLLVCCLLMLVRAGKSKEVALGKVTPSASRAFAQPSKTARALTFLLVAPSQLHEVHSRLCARRQVGGVSQSECLSLCALLESRGVFALKKAKEARLSKVKPDAVAFGI